MNLQLESSMKVGQSQEVVIQQKVVLSQISAFGFENPKRVYLEDLFPETKGTFRSHEYLQAFDKIVAKSDTDRYGSRVEHLFAIVVKLMEQRFFDYTQKERKKFRSMREALSENNYLVFDQFMASALNIALWYVHSTANPCVKGFERELVEYL